MYIILGIVSLIKKELIAADNIIAGLFCLLFIYIDKKCNVNNYSAFFAGLAFLPHVLGVYGLYELASLNYHYDWIVHISTGIISTIAIMCFLLHKTYFEKKFMISFLIAIAVTSLFGSVIEMSEYWGFRFIGWGEGYLGFGVGDNSANFGPWENSSLDTSFNLLGSVIALGVYFIFRKLKKNK